MRVFGQLLVAVLVSAAAGGRPVVAQSTLAFQRSNESSLLLRPAHLTVSDMLLPEALERLRTSAGVPIAYSVTLLPRDWRVSCDCDQVTVADALDRLLRATGFRFEEVGVQIVIRPQPTVGPAPDLNRSTSVPAGDTAAPVEAPTFFPPEPTGEPEVDQDPVVSGIVVAAGGKPVADAQIVLAGGRVGAVTGADGRFRVGGLGRTGVEVTIQVRRIGFRTESQAVRIGDLDVRVVLTELAFKLDEVVVTGTAGGGQARSIGNAVSEVNVADLVQRSSPRSLQELISSSVSGVNMISAPGNVGAGAAIRIRGASSASLGSAPLIYLDGVRIDNNQNASITGMRGGTVSRLNDLSPEEVEAIEVIKGPAAATLFGTEASAGVIQIITKKGRGGPAEWDIKIGQGASWLSRPLSRWPAVYDRSTTPCTNCRLLANGIREFAVLESEIQRGIGTPWSTGHNQSFGASVRGGTDLVRYFFSGQFDRNEGYVDWNWQNKAAVRANLELTPNQRLTVSTNIGFLRSNTRYDAPGPFPAEIVSSIYWGTPKAADSRSRGWNWTPPEALATVEAKESYDRFTGSATIRHSPMSWLTHKLTAGADIGNSVPSRLFPRSPLGSADYFGALSLGSAETINRTVTNANVDYGATASVNLLKDLVVETSAGGQYYLTKTHEQGATGTRFPVPGRGTVSSAAIKTGFEDFLENKTFGLYVQQQLGWKNRRFLTAAVRGDDNSAFGENFNFVVYPKFSASWVLHEEPFWKIRPVSSFKLRAAWGRAGRQPDVFAARRLYAPITAAADQPGLTADAVGNPDLKPEVGEELELGFDAGILNERISAQLTFYDKKTKDAILRRSVAPSSGFAGSQFVNAGLIRNRGVELALNGRIVETRTLEWGLGVNVATNHSKVISLGALPPIVLFGQRHVEGFPVGAVFMFNVLSAQFDAAGKVINALCEATPEQGGGTVPCSQAQPVYRGPALPTWEGDVSSSLRYGNLTVQARVGYEGGYTKISGDLAASHLLFRNSKQILERTDPVLAAMAEITGDWLQGGVIKGGFAKLREVSVNYRLPKRIAGIVGARAGSSVTVAAYNLANLWWAQRENFGRAEIDPELSRQWTAASDFNAYHQTSMPAPSTLTMTLRLVF